MDMIRALRRVLVSAMLLVAACAIPSGSLSPIPAPATTAQATIIATSLTHSAAVDLLRGSTSFARPLLLPDAVPASWLVDVEVEPFGSFTAIYREPTAARTLTLMVAAIVPPVPGAFGIQTDLAFRGDQLAVYVIENDSIPTSDRFLSWIETGVWSVESRDWPGWPAGGVPYSVSTTGIDESEFWQLVNSLHPDERG